MTPTTDRIHLLIVDDHESVLSGTVSALEQAYPNAIIRTATTVEAVDEELKHGLPNVLVMDLSIPSAPNEPSQIESGIDLLRRLMEAHTHLNIVVQSAHIKALIRLMPSIYDHRGGFTIADKNLPLREMLEKVDWALKGVVYTPQHMRTRLEIRPEWLQVLQHAFGEGLQDKAIAERINVSERTVRHYWSKLQDALSVYPEAGKNIRIQTEIRAREEGLID